MKSGAEDRPIRGSGEHSVRHSRRLSDELVEDARRIFQRRTGRKLTAEDARQILENLIGFFSILHEWDRAGASETRRGCQENDPDVPS